MVLQMPMPLEDMSILPGSTRCPTSCIDGRYGGACDRYPLAAWRSAKALSHHGEYTKDVIGWRFIGPGRRAGGATTRAPPHGATAQPSRTRAARPGGEGSGVDLVDAGAGDQLVGGHLAGAGVRDDPAGPEALPDPPQRRTPGARHGRTTAMDRASRKLYAAGGLDYAVPPGETLRELLEKAPPGGDVRRQGSRATTKSSK